MSAGTTMIDREWLAAHPLPDHSGADKDGRGSVLLVGGAEFVPGALRLSAEAALRAGAGRCQMGTVEGAAILLGVMVPEAAVIALPTNAQGEIASEAADRLTAALDRCDCAILGPGTHRAPALARCVERLLGRPRAGLSVVLDAGAIAPDASVAARLALHQARAVLTPHHGEMARLSGLSREAVAANPEKVAGDMASRLGAVIVLKARRTVVAAPDGGMLVHESDCPGLATGGSGDVLAGVIGGLIARGMTPMEGAAWGVWLHASAGAELSETVGPVGFLARDLLAHIPRLMARS